jgi:hypothetical protein
VQHFTKVINHWCKKLFLLLDGLQLTPSPSGEQMLQFIQSCEAVPHDFLHLFDFLMLRSQ